MEVISTRPTPDARHHLTWWTSAFQRLLQQLFSSWFSRRRALEALAVCPPPRPRSHSWWQLWRFYGSASFFSNTTSSSLVISQLVTEKSNFHALFSRRSPDLAVLPPNTELVHKPCFLFYGAVLEKYFCWKVCLNTKTVKILFRFFFVRLVLKFVFCLRF